MRLKDKRMEDRERHNGLGLLTRQSLLSRLRDLDDQESWKTFFESYGNLIFSAAAKAGLTESEAEEVVQETVIATARKMPDFKYDPAKGSFKSWLMQLTRWRIVAQFRKRQKDPHWSQRKPGFEEGTTVIEQVPDPAPSALEALWNEEWDENLREAALERVRKKVDAKQYQIFDFHVLKKWPVARVSEALEINPGRVYLAKHRVGRLLKKEIEDLRRGPG
jgi:RNA polymerase sigma factor (sigma-70 family)